MADGYVVQARLGDSLRAALPVPRERHAVGAMQRELGEARFWVVLVIVFEPVGMGTRCDVLKTHPYSGAPWGSGRSES